MSTRLIFVLVTGMVALGATCLDVLAITCLLITVIVLCSRLGFTPLSSIMLVFILSSLVSTVSELILILTPIRRFMDVPVVLIVRWMFFVMVTRPLPTSIVLLRFKWRPVLLL